MKNILYRLTKKKKEKEIYIKKKEIIDFKKKTVMIKKGDKQ